MIITQKINSWTRNTTPDFKYIAEDLSLGDFVVVTRDTLKEKSDKRALPTALQSKVSPIYELPDSMRYLIVRCREIVIGGQHTVCSSINKYIPIEKIYSYEDESSAYCILLKSTDRVFSYNMVTGLKVTTILSGINPRYRILLDGDTCPLNIYTTETINTSGTLLDMYHYLLYKSIDKNTINIKELDDKVEISGDVSWGILNINTYEYEEVQNIESVISLPKDRVNVTDIKIEPALEKILIYKCISEVNKDLLIKRLEEMLNSRRGK